MRPAVKHWLFLIFLVVTLAAMVAFALWQMSKARQRGPTRLEQPSAAVSALSVHHILARRLLRA